MNINAVRPCISDLIASRYLHAVVISRYGRCGENVGLHVLGCRVDILGTWTDVINHLELHGPSRRAIHCSTGDSNQSQYCTWLFSQTLYQLSYPRLYADLLGCFSHLHFRHLLFLLPEWRPGMSDVTLLSGISGLSFDSPFLSPFLFFLPSPLALSVLSFFC